MILTSLSPLPDRAPQSMAGPSARGGHDGQVLPARVAALASKRENLMRRIAERKRARKGFRDLQARFEDATTRLIAIANKSDDREAKRKAAS